ncbi:electroneutral sodium bicarbonate exchanger 1 isoform X8 [Trichogramma pretiosum]|uniref:electroneutral sodium bicarbonate exchanger 1 isoform X8 n=1 Tax=Trichogramma pretiosum TaxID=7493 RepID=UPI0006C985B5|nr:electroneutral sodium bicarbonate exchanger 1 isoform X8 [Trichogramma pretiosum]
MELESGLPKPWMQSGGGSAGGGGHQPTSGGGGQAANTTTGGGGTGDDEAPKDPGARITHQSYTESDFEVTPPAQRVQFILGEEVGDDAHESHPLFSEMEELCRDGDELEWKETARWIKFEEDVEEGGNRWSKPHVATLSLHSLFELRSLLLNGTVILDMEASGLEQITDLVLDNMVSKNDLSIDVKDQVREILLVRHRHQFERKKEHNMSRLPIIRSLAEIGRNHSSSKNCGFACGIQSLLTTDFQERQTNNGDAYMPAVPRSTSCPNSNTALLSKEAKDLKGPYLLVPVEESNSAPAIAATAAGQGGGAALNSSGRFLTIPGQEPTQTGMDRSPSSVSISRNHSANALENGDANHKGNVHFMRKIPPGAEASNILVGEVEFLDKSISAFIRLSQANIMGDLTEVPVPTRFIFILLGPMGGIASFHEIGRAMATLMSDEVFHEVAYKAKNKTHLLSGIDEFLDAVTVLPPGEWDPTIRIEPPAAIPSQEIRKRPKDEKIKEEVDEEADEQKLREESGLSRTGKLFGGLVNDIKRKKPFYLSDFKDACSLQCIASFIFLYFACLSPIITFGGLLSEATGKNMAAMESLVSGFVCGEGYALFSGQPLTILGSTGPVLVFESIVYEFCQKCGWHYMSFRFWIGTWMAVILIVLVAVDASALVCFITRFTEENFATLIAFIFIYKAIENVMSIRKKFPVSTGQNLGNSSCFCGPPGTSLNSSYSTTNNQYSNINWASLDKYACQAANGTVIGENCFSPPPVPDVFLMSIILFAGTFLISIHLKDFKNALFFPAKVRQIISDFAVIIAIFSMTALDASVGINTPKLEVPSEFKPTLDGRGWIIMPFNHNPWWSAVVAVLPALLGTILVFMDQQITAVIVNRKENKLKKGCGYHLDLFVLALLIQLCSFMGLPWFVAATVLSINHVNSLKLESECAAPGEKPQFLGVREQRVTAILIFLMIGCSVLLTPMLKHIPMPVLFGVFLYMGVASLKGLQFFDRILIIFMPQKYQPDYMFLRQVPIRKVHLFTAIQLACLICLWTIKSFSVTSIFFPLMLVVMIGIRKSLDLIFTQRDLKILDDVMPEYHKKHADDLRQLENGEEHNESLGFASAGNLQIPLVNGNIMKIPLTSINISEEVNKTGIWQQVNEENDKSKQPKMNNVGKQKKHSKKDAALASDETTRLTTMTEEEEEDGGISIKVDLIRSKDTSPHKVNGTTSAETSV